MSKMLFVYALSSALAMSAVFGRSSQATQVTYDESELQAKEDQTTMMAGIALDHTATGDDRPANLKFVLAIQRSTMWTDIKQRTVKISTNPRLTALLDADPDSLSDADLALLKKACHDGLKCVAVDQLLVLRSATKTLPNGLVAVRKVITKITHVLTNYTTEYYEDTYQYEEVSESESDPSKLDETVTVIVEDNKELCGIRVGDDVALMEDETTSTTITRDSQKVVEGTVTIRPDGSDSAAAKKTTSAAKTTTTTPAAKTTTTPAAKAVTPVAKAATPVAKAATPAAKVVTPVPETILLVGDDEKDYDDDDDDNDDDAEDDSADKNRAPSKNRDHGDLLDREARASGQAYRANDSAKQDAVTPIAPKIPSFDQDLDQDDDDDSVGSGSNRSVKITNIAEDDGGDSGDSLTKTDVATAGDNNATAVKKGYVEDGVMNNGDMNLYNVNKGTINKGIVNRSDADGGIVNVGTLNNGPTNYGTANNYENYGAVTKVDDTDIRQYLSSIDQMYSTIIDNFGKK